MPGEWETLSRDDQWSLLYAYRGRQKIAAQKLEEAIDYGMQAGINGQSLAPIFLQVSRCYRRAMSEECLSLATSALNQVLEVYPAYPQELINDERGNLEKFRGYVANETEQRIKRQQQLAKSKAQLDAYNARLAKQKAEEDFWKR